MRALEQEHDTATGRRHRATHAANRAAAVAEHGARDGSNPARTARTCSHVLVNSLLFRERRDGEAIMFKGKPLSESYAAVQAMLTEFDARSRILENAHRVHNTAIERCAEASDIANVRVGAQSAAHSALADDAEAEACPGDELAPLMMHVAVLDRHEQQQESVLEGLSAMCRSGLPAATSYVDAVQE